MFHLTTHSTHFIYGYMVLDEMEEGINVLINDALNTFYLVIWCWMYDLERKCMIWRERKEMFYLMTHSTHFIYSYMASDVTEEGRKYFI